MRLSPCPTFTNWFDGNLEYVVAYVLKCTKWKIEWIS